MILLIFFICFFFFSYRRNLSLGLLLILFYICSISGGLFIGKKYTIENFHDIVNFIYLCLMLYLLISPWLKYKYSVNIIGVYDTRKLYKVFKALCAINGISFIIFLVTVILAFQTVTDYSQFKNGNASAEFFANKLPVNQYVYLLAVYLHSSAYFLIPFHFYYLLNKKYKYSLIALLFSLNIILQGMTVFSRSGFISFFMCYIIFLPFFYNKLEFKIKKRIRILAVYVFAVACSFFYLITENRFTDTITYDSEIYKSKYIKSPVVFSLLDYGTQWFQNSRDLMAKYDFEILYGRLTFSFPELVLTSTGLADFQQLEKVLSQKWGSYFDKFNGITANLLFDLGYVGSLIFVLIYRSIVFKLQPTGGAISINNLMFCVILVMIPAMGFFNSEMKVVFFNLAIIYGYLIYKYLKIKFI